MNRRFQPGPLADPVGPAPDDGPESPSSVDEPSHKKSKKGVHKRIVSVPIGGADVEGSNNKSKGESSYPPSDSWAWRKYGQKPIKGSPYPRGYYRCSSSKGCPARKQVERSRVDPTTLIITYACDHNHPNPTKSLSATSTRATSPAAPKSTEDEGDDLSVAIAAPAAAAFSGEESGTGVGGGGLLGGEGFEQVSEWFDVASSTAIVLESPIYGGGAYVDADVSDVVSGEEDESLFGDLGELPECAVVFRRRIAVPCCSSTG